MEVTRRKFLKFLSIGMAMAAAPVIPGVPAAAEKPFAAVQGMSYKWVSFDEISTIYSLRAESIDGDTPLDGTEEWLGFDKHPLFRGELGKYEGVTIHKHK